MGGLLQLITGRNDGKKGKKGQSVSMWPVAKGIIGSLLVAIGLFGISLLLSHSRDASTVDITPDPLQCNQPSQSFAWMSGTINRYRSNVRGVYAQLRNQLGHLEEAEDSFLIATLIDPCNSLMHFNLANIRTKRQNMDGAEKSFRNVLLLTPDDELARLLYDRVRQQKAQGFFWGHMAGIVQEYPALNVTDEGLLDIPTESTDTVKERLQTPLSTMNDWHPVRLVMNLDRVSDNQLHMIIKSEKDSFQAECDGAEEDGISKFPTVLAEIRALENSTTWLIPWAVERLKYFNNPEVGMSVGAYGVTWFPSCRQLFSKQSVVSAFRGIRTRGLVVVLGSGLGYQCLFAVALGAKKCIGYDIMCKTMVKPSRDLIAKHGLNGTIDLRCGDAREAQNLTHASLVWINDGTFSREVSLEVHQKVAKDLNPNALMVSYAAPAGDGGSLRLQYEESMRVETSWSFVQPMHIFRKLSPGEAPRPPKVSQSQGGRRGSKTMNALSRLVPEL